MDQELLAAIRQIVREEVSPIKHDVSELNNSNYLTSEIKGELISFKEETHESLEDLKKDVEFLTNKEANNEREIYKLKEDKNEY